MSELKTGVQLSEENLHKVLQKFNEDLGMYINEEDRFKLGRVLTIIDASLADTEQRKAVKDLINNVWWGVGGDRAVRSDSMSNPHSDLRAICELFGFELYPESESTLNTPIGDDLTWLKKRYNDHLKTR